MTLNNQRSIILELDIDIVNLLNTLKKILKSKGLTYKEIGQFLDLSEVSVKRIFSQNDCSLSRLSAICSLVNLSILELSELTKKASENENFHLSAKQEKTFSENLKLFYFFRELYRGEAYLQVLKELSLEKEEGFLYLRKLESLEILEVLPYDQFKFKIKGRIRPKINGELFNKIIKDIDQQFLSYVYKNIENQESCFHSSEVFLRKKSFDKMVIEINEIGKKYRDIAYQEEKITQKKDLIDVRWLFALAPYKTDLKQYL